MANCVLCGKKIGAFDKSFGTFGIVANASICESCFNVTKNFQNVSKSGDVTKANELSQNFIQTYQNDVAKKISASFLKIAEEGARDFEVQRKKEQETKEKNQALLERTSNMILTTTSSLEGYKVVKHLGLVFGELVYKAKLGQAISATIENISDSLSFGQEIEMSGTAQLLERARTFALEKLKKAAGEKGANAVIGIDAESSAGGDVIHATIYGTAVYVEKIEG